MPGPLDDVPLVRLVAARRATTSSARSSATPRPSPPGSTTSTRAAVPDDLVADVVARHGIRRAVLSAEPEAIAVGDQLAAIGVTTAPLSPDAAATADLGVTSCVAAIATTGTVVVSTTAAGGRSASLLPPGPPLRGAGQPRGADVGRGPAAAVVGVERVDAVEPRARSPARRARATSSRSSPSASTARSPSSWCSSGAPDPPRTSHPAHPDRRAVTGPSRSGSRPGSKVPGVHHEGGEPSCDCETWARSWWPEPSSSAWPPAATMTTTAGGATTTAAGGATTTAAGGESKCGDLSAITKAEDCRPSRRQRRHAHRSSPACPGPASGTAATPTRQDQRPASSTAWPGLHGRSSALENLDVRNESFDSRSSTGVVTGLRHRPHRRSSINDERKKVVDFTEPLLRESQQGILAKAGTKVTTLDEAKKLKWGVQTGTTGESLLDRHREAGAASRRCSRTSPAPTPPSRRPGRRRDDGHRHQPRPGRRARTASSRSSPSSRNRGLTVRRHRARRARPTWTPSTRS